MASKEEIASEKAFKQAVEATQAPAKAADAAAAPESVSAPAKKAARLAKPARRSATAKKSVARKTPASKAAPKKAATKKAAPKKAVAAKRVAPKKAAPAKTVSKTTAKPVIKTKETPVMSKKTTFAPKMTVAEVQKKAAEVAADVQSKSKEVAAEVQKYSKEAYAKGSKLVSEGTAITKANAEAVVASGKIVAAGVKDMTEKNVAVSRKAVGTFGDDLKAFADVKSPSALLEMQGKLAARNYDAMVDYMSKTSTLFGDVAKAAFAPLSARTKATYETISKAA